MYPRTTGTYTLKKSLITFMQEQAIKQLQDYTVNDDLRDEDVTDLTFSKSYATIKGINPNNSHFVTLATTAGYWTTSVTSVNGNDLFEEVTHKILTLEGSYMFEEAITTIESFIAKAGNNFYGAVLRSTTDNKRTLNPYHPLTAYTALKNPIKDKFTVILYFYKNRSKFDIPTQSARLEVADAKSNLHKLLSLLQPHKHRAIEVRELSREFNEKTNELAIHRAVQSNIHEMSSASVVGKNIYLMSHQLLTRGLLAPYYGVSALAVKPAIDTSAIHLTPLRSANVSGSLPSSSIVYNGICTGSQPRTTFKGMSTLDHANLSSPLNRQIVLPGALVYVDVCIDITRELYKKAGILKSFTPIASDLSINQEHLEALKEDKQKFAEFLVNEGRTPLEAAQYILQLQEYL